MAPIQTTKHSRAVRSARNPRGIYAPPDPSANDRPITQETSAPDVDADADAFASFKLNKQDKRSLRHQALMAKIREENEGRRKGKVLKRKRRPGKKLGVELGGDGGLGEALPDVSIDVDEGDDAGEWEGIEEEVGMEELAGLRKARRRRRVGDGKEGKMVMKSLKTRPGSLLRKRKVEGRERERFERNLASMVVGMQSKQGGGEMGEGKELEQRERWEALRQFIGGTMERSGAFAGGVGGGKG